MFAAWSYRERGGAYCALDERARILVALGGVVACVATTDPVRLGGLLAAGVLVFLLARIRFVEVRRFAFFAALLTAILVTATYLMWEPPADGSETRVERAVGQTLRILALATFSVVPPFTVDPGRWGVAMRRLGMPSFLAYAVELSMRFVPEYAGRLELVRDAQAARGFEPDPPGVGPLGRLRRRIPWLVPVALDALVAGDDLADAMDLRAFGTGPRTWSAPSSFGAGEWLAAAGAVALLAWSLWP